ncbi:MAG TPA: MarR family transcriptional regulator [Trebonia sp.]|nr:MarR family transcriptional regulator [Trebonia sp.]
MDTGKLAVDLSVALSRLRSRLREEAGANAQGLTVSQLAMLQRLADNGPMTAAALAAAEHVTKQAIAQRLAAMQPGELIETAPDPADGRKVLVVLSPAGRALLEKLHRTREAWLVRAIESELSEAERPALRTAVELLERLASADLSPEVEIR